jgi:mannose/cellobiose epimerase-like protein (N-acyl-D-glucosamine 2-epimerase family)/anti-anti-sigma regulatory factor
MNDLKFSFSDLVAGYVVSVAPDGGSFQMKTSDDRLFTVTVTEEAYAELIRNLGEPWQDPGASTKALPAPGRYVFAYGVFYPEPSGTVFELKHLVVVGSAEHDWRFEAPDWWITQIRELGRFYFESQFGDGPVDFAKYRTHLTMEGQKLDATRQETDTISRMVYGFATAYMLTGEDRFLEAAERGTEYLRTHMRALVDNDTAAYWYHAVDVSAGRERKILASEFGDDYDAIPAYEQIYALAGPVQTFRVTGDPRILQDAERTLNLFEKYFRDKTLGGYFSHIDPVHFDPRDESLTHNRARKNWNSVGDHAPAYLINLWLATGDERCRAMLVDCADTICRYFPDYDSSPFVNEKFFEDWSHDHETPLQKNRAIVGHNLKIAWNLMRIFHMTGTQQYADLAEKIGAIIPGVGLDRQRGGVYDMVERQLAPGDTMYRLVWHDRKAWWQQEQGILAYLILAGSLKKPEYEKLARELAAFYNAWFPDVDSGGVYFNVLAAGAPYALGTERLKGSHSMSGYHSFELCYLAAVYTNLLITRQPLDLYFKPLPGAWTDGTLRVLPDILPAGSVRIEAVWIDDVPYANFEAETGIVYLPEMQKAPAAQRVAASAAATGSTATAVSAGADLHPLLQRPQWAGNPALTGVAAGQGSRSTVRVRIAPHSMAFDVSSTLRFGVAEICLIGSLDHAAEAAVRLQLTRAAAAHPRRVVLRMEEAKSLSDDVARLIAFLLGKFDPDCSAFIVGATDEVGAKLSAVNLSDAVQMLNDMSSLPK